MRNMRDEVLEMLRDMNDNDLVAVHNEYCEKVRYDDDRIYYMEELDELMYGMKPIDILREARDVDTNDDWIRWNGYGNLESTVCPVDDGWIDIDEIADYIIDNDDALDNDEIREILDEEEDEEEED